MSRLARHMQRNPAPKKPIVVPCSREQAAILSQRMQAAATAQQAAQDTLTLLTAGKVPPGAVLENINTDTGELTFTVAVPGG